MPFTQEIRKNTHFTTGFYSFIFLLTWFGTNIVLGFNFTFLTTVMQTILITTKWIYVSISEETTAQISGAKPLFIAP